MKSLRLAALPEFDPPPQLWARIEAAHRRRRQRRRLVQWGAGMAAVLALAAIVTWLPSTPTAPAAANPLAQLQRQSHELEQRYAGLEAAAAALDGETELSAAELALQRAYDRGASAEELLPLWQQRNEVLSGLIAVAADGAQLTRI
ncbi:hypothetical protein [Tahibacter caeni]|uniref:hypothetical protein n=1 Tax=Tahibacter caeni TaxID=1453545 RepID=UPI002147F7BF|nr:hypothetical protein [Tahibacter caeni]